VRSFILDLPWVLTCSSDNTQDLQQSFRDETSRRQSDIIPVDTLEDQDDTTFVFSFPRRNEDGGTSAFSPGEGLENDAGLSPELEQSHHQIGRAAVTAVKANPRRTKSRSRTKKVPKLSKHGIPYPSLPSQVVKKLASTFARASGNGKSPITKEALVAIMQASDWFFEQVSDDLGTYAKHAHRKTIDETDMITLLKRCVPQVQTPQSNRGIERCD
jgi:histone H3/H4